jgi:hypothetical protein
LWSFTISHSDASGVVMGETATASASFVLRPVAFAISRQPSLDFEHSLQGRRGAVSVSAPTTIALPGVGGFALARQHRSYH